MLSKVVISGLSWVELDWIGGNNYKLTHLFFKVFKIIIKKKHMKTRTSRNSQSRRREGGWVCGRRVRVERTRGGTQNSASQIGGGGKMKNKNKNVTSVFLFLLKYY